MSGWPASTMHATPSAAAERISCGHDIEILDRALLLGGRQRRQRHIRTQELAKLRHDPGHEIAADGQMLMKQRRAARQRIGRQVLEHGADDRAARKARFLFDCAEAVCECGGGAGTEPADDFAAIGQGHGIPGPRWAPTVIQRHAMC